MRISLKRDSQMPDPRAFGLLSLAEGLKYGTPQEAEPMLIEALTLFGDHPLAANCYLALSMICRQANRSDEADGHIEKGLAWAEEKLGLIADETRELRKQKAWLEKREHNGLHLHSLDRDALVSQDIRTLYQETIDRAKAQGNPEFEGLLLGDMAKAIDELCIHKDDVIVEILEQAAPLLLAHKDKLPARVAAEHLLRLAILRRIGKNDNSELQPVQEALAILQGDKDFASSVQHNLLQLLCETVKLHHRYLRP